MLGFHKFKNCFVKDTANRMKRHVKNGKKYLRGVYLISDFCPEYKKNSNNSITKKKQVN